MLFVNFKTYKEGTSKNAVELLQKLVTVQRESGVAVVPVVQVSDARFCANTTPYGVWVQHVDFQEPGQSTGWVTVESVAECGAVGTFLNHAEHKIPFEHLESILSKCQYHSIETMVFAGDMEELERVVKLKPSFVCYEPAELIASKETSVADSQPEIIKKAVEISGKIRLVVGAGIKKKRDVEVCKKLGAYGVAVSSAVVLSEDPEEVLLDLVAGFK